MQPMTTQDLNSQERAELRKLSHRVQPSVAIGKAGLSEAIIKALNEALTAHELVKLKFHDFSDEKNSICLDLANQTSSALVSIIGNVGIFYRPALNPEERLIQLGKKKRSVQGRRHA
jgi:RNA-binding protein